MKTLIPLVPLATLTLAAAGFVSMAGAGPAPASAPTPAPTPAPIPVALVPEGKPPRVLTLAARGVQIYECRAGGSGAEWAFVAPEAELLDAQGRRAGSHGAGPFWQAGDGSRIVGTLSARQNAPAAGAIPWLLLQARSTGGAGVFSRIGHVQRVNTEGGVAPADGCTLQTLGQTVRVPYRADYHFYQQT